MDEVRYCPYCMTPVKENGVCPACGLTEGSYVPAPHHLLPGTVLQDRYLIGRVLGEGGFGITYVGRDTSLGLKIAVKEYYPVGNAARNNQESVTVTSSSRTTGTYEKGKSKFLQEAMTMGKLEKEPQIVGVKDFFQENNTAYIVMEYIEGTTLKELTAQRGGRIPADELFEMIKPMFGAIQHMHDLGLIHRDISPDNLMLENGDIKLLDFGCAKDVTDSSQVNQQTQTLILKHGYSPFEQYQMSSNQGPWTDVYAFGASIYYCLTGNPPPRSTDRIMGDNIVPPHKLGIKITEWQEDALMKALAVRPVDRFSSMEQFQGALYGNTVETIVGEKAQKKGQIRKPKQKKTAPAMGLTVREKLFDSPEEEPEEVYSETEPAKDPDRILTAEEKPLFVTDEIVVPKDKLEEKKKSDNKTVIIAVVAIILVIALAVTGIVWAIVGSRDKGDSAVASTTQNWLSIAGVNIGTYQDGDVSYDAYTKTISLNESYSAIGWEFSDELYLESIKVYLSEMYSLKLEVTYTDGTTVDTGYPFGTSLSLDLDSTKPIAHIALLNAVESGEFKLTSVTYKEGSGEEEIVETSSEISPITNHWELYISFWTSDLEAYYSAPCVATGQIEFEFSMQDLLDTAGLKLDDISELDGCEIVCNNLRSIDANATFALDVYVNDELTVSRTVAITSDFAFDSEVMTITNLLAHEDGDYEFSADDVVRVEIYNVQMAEIEVSYPWSLTYTDGAGHWDENENRWYEFEPIAIDGLASGEQNADSGYGNNVVFFDEHSMHSGEFVTAVLEDNTYLQITTYSKHDEFMLYLCFCDTYTWIILNAGDDLTVTEHSDGTCTYTISCSDLLDIIEENGCSIYDIVTASVQCDDGTVFKSFKVVKTDSITNGSIAVSENGTTTYLNHADYTDENMYIEVTYSPDLTLDEENRENDVADWGAGSIWSVDDDGSWLDRVVETIPSYHQTNGIYAISLTDLAEIFASTGSDLGSGIVIESGIE